MVGDFFKGLVTLYLTIWLLLLKKIKSVYQLDGNRLNFGVFLKLVGLNREEPSISRSVSVPTMQRSTSIRERRRFLSDRGEYKRDNSYSRQQFVLRRKKSSDQENLGRVKVTCRKSLLHAKHEAKRSRYQGIFDWPLSPLKARKFLWVTIEADTYLYSVCNVGFRKSLSWFLNLYIICSLDLFFL